MEHNQITINYAMINHQCAMVIQICCCWEVILAVRDMYALVAIIIVEFFKQEPIYGLTTGTKISGHCREVAKSGQVPL